MLARTWPYQSRRPAGPVGLVSSRPREAGPVTVSRRSRNDSLATLSNYVFLFLAGHAVLAIAMHRFLLLATAHAWVSFAVACYVAVTSRQQAHVIFAAGYLVASEILWRMTSAGVFWEFGKYGVSAVLLLALCRRRPRQWNWLAVGYFMLLIPSALLTCTELPDVARLRQAISSNLSGPFSLAVCAVCLSRTRLALPQLSGIILAMLGPLTGAAAICSYATTQLGADYEFGSESNFDVTGGFGPNQVSSILGLAILLAFLWVHLHQNQRIQRTLGIALVLFFFAQAALTFSRTGVWIGIGTILTASLFIVRDRRRFFSGVASLVLVLLVGCFVVYPLLDSFTRGKLSARLAERGFSNREAIAKGDLELGLRHPIFGVGLGMAKLVRAKELGVGGATHTEFTRLIAEHGLFGIGALGMLLLLGLQAWTGARSQFHRAWTTSLIAYAVLFMLASAMRLAAPALAVGLALLRLRPSAPTVAPSALNAQASSRVGVSKSTRLRPLPPPTRPKHP